MEFIIGNDGIVIVIADCDGAGRQHCGDSIGAGGGEGMQKS